MEFFFDTMMIQTMILTSLLTVNCTTTRYVGGGVKLQPHALIASKRNVQLSHSRSVHLVAFKDPPVETRTVGWVDPPPAKAGQEALRKRKIFCLRQESNARPTNSYPSTHFNTHHHHHHHHHHVHEGLGVFPVP